MRTPCDFHNEAISSIAAVEAIATRRMDSLESYLHMLHDKISILTKRVEQLETDVNRKPYT